MTGHRGSGFVRLLASCVVLLSWALAPAEAGAQEEPVTELPFNFYLGAGPFAPNRAGDLDYRGGAYALFAGVGGLYQDHLAWEAELAGYNRNFRNTVPSSGWGTMDNTMSLSTEGVVVRAKRRAAWSAADLYAGIGLGYFRSTLTATGQVFGLPVEKEKTSSSIGLELSVGLETPYRGGTSVGAAYRYLSLHGSFGEMSGGGVDIGGSYLCLIVRF